MISSRAYTKSNWLIFWEWVSSKYFMCISVYVTQKYHKLDTFTRENTTHLVVFNSGSSHEDISKIIRRYTDDVKNASMVINSYLRKGKFVIFDLTRPEDDPLAIRLRFNTSLNLQKEIMVRQKRKEKVLQLM